MVAEECGDEYATAVMMTARSCPSAANLKGYAGRWLRSSYQRRQVLQLLDEMRGPSVTARWISFRAARWTKLVSACQPSGKAA